MKNQINPNIMFKLIRSIFVTIALILFSLNINQTNDSIIEVGVSEALAGGCTICRDGVTECHRIIQGNEVHIFYGEAEDCSSTFQ